MADSNEAVYLVKLFAYPQHSDEVVVLMKFRPSKVDNVGVERNNRKKGE